MERLRRIEFFMIIFHVLVIATTTANGDDNQIDTRDGEELTLQCRFSPDYSNRGFIYYWARSSSKSFENVAVDDKLLSSTYKVDYRPDQGIYDLKITNATYSRDNGHFECRIKAQGTGDDVHQQYYNVTVLTPPQPPLVAPGSSVVATEEKKQELTCSSIGGSPDPTITWYREGSTTPLPGIINRGGSKDHQTTSTLTITPTKDDDGAKFRCVVFNRAMKENEKYETTVVLSVNYYPRVDIGPENPLRVERDGTAKLDCRVDSKPKVTNVRWMRGGRFISSSFTHTIHRVTLQDAGEYECTADNGLGRNGVQKVALDVLYPPVVVIETKTREAEERESISIKCNVTSNPPPVEIEWLKENNPDFRQSGDVLSLADIRAENAGTYICRGINNIRPSGGKGAERIGNTTVAVLVRHRPGKAVITPNHPVVHVGSGVTLKCSASPPGWPIPQYRWFRDVEGDLSTQNILAQGSEFVIPRAHLGSEGRYHCHAANEMGHGEMATITLEVHQPPQFLAKLQQHLTRRVGDSDFSVSCSAKGKPKPQVKWFKDGRELTGEMNYYEISTSPNEGPNGMVTVQSNLKFSGKMRQHGNQLMSGDRGTYSCVYVNEVSSNNSTMNLKIEHEPIVLHKFNKVAADLRESVEIMCKVQAYPKPEFQWTFGTNTATIQQQQDSHYEVSNSADGNDVYTSILKVANVGKNDYGDYYCRASNSLETIRTGIRLQPKGAPEKPTDLDGAEFGPNYISLNWTPGFDGGIKNTKFFVLYRKVSIPSNEINGDCDSHYVTNTEWSEFDCHTDYPCNITPLDQHSSYVFKVKALNNKGASEYSNEVTRTTKVSKIPKALQVTFDPMTKILGVDVGSTCLALIAVVESVVHDDAYKPEWRIVKQIPLHASGSSPTHEKSVVENIQMSRSRNAARSLELVEEEDFTMALEDDPLPHVRVKLCLKGNPEYCGEYTIAEIGPPSFEDVTAMTTPTLIAIAVSCIVFALLTGLLLMFCKCKRKQTKKSVQAKDYEMDSVRPSIVAQQNQAPPPYYPASGLDNKALEHSMDLALALEEQKSAIYAAQNGYGYGSGIQVPTHNMPADWVNMAYMENSYSNSNNGGSVNSQDSLYQMKMTGAAGNSGNLISQHHQYVDRQAPYGYDPLTHGGYGTVDDYATYPHLTTTPSQQLIAEEYHTQMMMAQQPPSRQDFCTDPYAAVHKPNKKRLDSQMESPYHDVSGLPDPYMEQMQMGEDQIDHSKVPQQQHHMPMGYDETLESGYSTPNSRNRRVIREIIV